jgi:hypothetical protein
MEQERRKSERVLPGQKGDIVPPEGYLDLPEPSYMHIQQLEKAFSDLEQRIYFLEEMLATFSLQMRVYGPVQPPTGPEPFPTPGFPSTAIPGGQPPGGVIGFWWGPVLHAPESHLIQTCKWSSVTVILVKRGVVGGVTPMVGSNIWFKITFGTGVSISSTPGGPGVRPGVAIKVKTNSMGEATIHIHGATRGTATLESDGPGLSKDTTIDIV